VIDSELLDVLFALGFKESIVGIGCAQAPFAVEGCFPFGLSSNQLENIESIGSYPPSLEKILSLEPDLILGLEDWLRLSCEQLSDIAPTVLLNKGRYWDFSSFETYIRYIAQLFNREEIAEEIILQYQNRIAEVRRQLDDRLKNVEVSVIIYGCGGNNGFSVSSRNAIHFQVLDDLGIKVKPIFSMNQQFGLCSMSDSIETINKYDSDILFILNTHSEARDFLLEKPLIASLNAVKNGRAYVIDGQDVWDVYGPSGVNRLLDILSKHLLEAAQSF
jgi:iron complex transport system substrate-binding protein